MKELTNYLRAAYYLFKIKKHASWTPSRLARYQDKKIREIVRYAYENVPFYHESFRKSNIKPDEVRTADDLKKIRIITKDDVKNNVNQMISNHFNVERLKRIVTSGSTGKPLAIYVSQQEDELRKARHLRANIVLGQKPRDRYVVITGPQHFSEISKFQKLLGIYVPTSVSVFDDEPSKVSKIRELDLDVLDGYSSSLYLLAKEVERQGIKTIRPRFIIGGAELTDNHQKSFIEKTFDAPFFDQYACSEFERLAFQCKERIGYHIDADSVVMQFVDKNGEEVAPGETGEIVCTSLFNYSMPLIRYAVDDIGAGSEESCPCGRTFPLMKLIEGRKDSIVILPSGRLVTPHIFCLNMESFRFFGLIDQYRIIQKKTDLIEIQLTVKKNARHKEIDKELIAHFKQTLNLDADEVTFEGKFVDKIPLDRSGKLSTVVSELQQT
jgi:phenylacetate-CoA ligase